MSSGVTVAVPGSDEEIDRRTYRDIFGERRWLIGIAAIVAIVLVGVAALALRSSGRPDAEPVSAVAMVEAEAGTSVSVTRSLVTPTQLQVARLGGAQWQVARTVIVVDEAVLFEFDEAVLRPRAEAELDRILQVVRASGDEQVDVVGYTDAVSPQSYNLPLSRDRADAVATWLVEQGVNQRRLDVDWRGELDPVAPNTRADGEDHPEGRRLNRRVEIRIDGPAVVDPGSRPASGLGGAEAPSGATLVVDRVRVEPNAVLVDIRFVNPTAYPMSLNQQGIWLVDDLGTTYRFVPSPQNPAADVPAGSSMSGQLSFPGVVPSGASRVTLVTNADDPTSGEDAAGDVRDVLRSLAGGPGEDPAPTLVVRDVPLTR